MSHAGRKLTKKTHGAAHGEGSTSGRLVSKRTFGPGTEQPLPYADGKNTIEVLPGSVSACAAAVARPVSDVAATTAERANRRASRIFIARLLVWTVVVDVSFLGDACGFLVIATRRRQEWL